VTRYIVRRVLAMIPVMLLVSFMAFSLVHIVPGDPAVALAGDPPTEKRIEFIRAEYGFDDPFLVQYGKWLKDVVTGDLGESLFTDQPVASTIKSRLPITLNLVGGAALIAVLVGVPAGVLAATRRGRWTDRAINMWAASCVSLPNYFFGMLLIILFVLHLGWLPAVGYTGFFDNPWEWFKHLLLPCVSLSLLTMAVITRQLRTAMVGVLDQDYIRTAHAKGMTPLTVILKHGLKNATMPVVTIMGAQIALLVGGTVIIERMFAIPGLGNIAVEAVTRRDMPIIQGAVLVTAVIVQIVNLLSDIAYAYLNPKVRV
jgi:peptide/nickel transport system permease protein